MIGSERMYRYKAAKTVAAENSARIESFMYVANTGNIEVIYSVGVMDDAGVYTPVQRHQVTLQKDKHASVIKGMTDTIQRELFALLVGLGKLPTGQSQ